MLLRRFVVRDGLMKNIFARAVVLVSFCFLILLSLQLPAQTPAPVVILISMDGIRYDYPEKLELSAFKRMEQQGLRVGQLYPTFPSSTFPGHASIATGANPLVHGIIDNSFYDRKQRAVFNKDAAYQWLEAEPLWITAVRQGKRSAVYYWLGSEGQWHEQNATYFKSPFKSVSSESEKVTEILRWLDLPVDSRPDLMMSYWHGADAAGHEDGPDSKEVLSALRKQNLALQALIEGLDKRNAWPWVTLIVTSDHGMISRGERVDLAELSRQGNFKGWFRNSSAMAHLNLKKGYNKDKVYEFLKSQSQFDVYKPEQMPKEIRSNHPERSGDLVLIAKPGYWLSSSGFHQKQVTTSSDKKYSGGMHGYSPIYVPEMRTIFFAMGRGVKQGSYIKKEDMIDIASSVTKLLDINPPLQSEGKPFLPNQ